MSADDDTNVHDLLNTLLVPAYPPNRSQWKKLELALKFINMSKQSAKDTRSAAAKSKQAPKAVSLGTRNRLDEKDGFKEPSAKKPRMVMIEPCKTVSLGSKDESSWTKIKDSVQSML